MMRLRVEHAQEHPLDETAELVAELRLVVRYLRRCDANGEPHPRIGAASWARLLDRVVLVVEHQLRRVA